MENQLTHWLTLFLVALLIPVSFQCYSGSKIYIIADPDRSSIYVNGLFAGTFSSYHEQALEIAIDPGEHIIEAQKVDESNALLYQRKEVTLEHEEWRIVHIELDRHPEAELIDKDDINIEDYITAPPYWRYPNRRPKDNRMTTKEKKQQGPIQVFDLDFMFEYPLSLEKYALKYKALREYNTLTTPPPYMVEIPGGMFCDYSDIKCQSVEIKPFWLAKSVSLIYPSSQ